MIFPGVLAVLCLCAASPSTLPVKTCQEKSGATQTDIETLRNRKLPPTKTGRCFLECIFEYVKILDGGKFNKKGMTVVFAPALAGDFKKLGKLKELAEVCEDEIGTKPLPDCIGAEKVVRCVALHGKEHGITFPKAKL